MNRRPDPQPINYKRPLPEGLSSDLQVKKWLYRLKGDRAARPTRISEQQLAWVYREVMKDREEDFSPRDADLYLKAMSETCPILAAPELERTEVAEDLELMLSQPELRMMWDSWDGYRGPSGPAPDYWGAKALMATMGMAGISAHVDDNYAELVNNGPLLDVFQRLADRRGTPLPSYQHLCKQLPKVANDGLVMATNIAMIKALAELRPNEGIGERLLIDGMGFPAWVEQTPKGKTKRQEAYRRRLVPEAGPKAVVRTGRHKRRVQAGDSATKFMVSGDFWRGYYLVAIADQATGLPLVWIVQDANLDEADAIVPLMSRLFRLWPECPAKVIAGDSAWDEEKWCRLAEQDYGIHPIFRWHDERGEEMEVEGFSRDERVVAHTNKGQLICAAHRNYLKFRGAETPRRDDLRPGKSHPDKGAFRVRATCDDGCGALSLKMMASWRRLTYYPHFDQGGAAPERYAYRRAMLTRLNGVEAIWERLQVGRHVGNEGGNRTRVRDKGAHETIVALALLSMTASTLADQRDRAGITFLPPGSNPSPGYAPASTRGLNAATNHAAAASTAANPGAAPAIEAQTADVAVSDGAAVNGHGRAPAVNGAAEAENAFGDIFTTMLGDDDVLIGI